MRFPEFIATAITSKNTSIGDNKAFGDKTVSLPTDLLIGRYEQVISSVKDIFGYIPSPDDALDMLSKLIRDTMEIERPLRSQLESLCETVVNSTLNVPKETVMLECKLVDNIKPDVSLRIMPEIDESTEYSFKDVELNPNDEIMKRRFINTMVQGISYLLMMATYDVENIKEWNPELTELYSQIIALNDFLLFTKEENVTDENPMLGAHVETLIGKQDEQTIISSQGLVYPLLLQETYRGFFEMFAANGLPDDIADAKYVISKADIVVAEAWDLRIGVPIWQKIDSLIPDNTEYGVYPYLFSSIVIKPVDEFNRTIYDCMTHVEGTIEWLNDIIKQVIHDKEYQLFKKDIDRFNIEKTIVTDDNNDDNKIIG